MNSCSTIFQIRYHPAAVLERPIIGKPDELSLFGQVRKERKRAARQGPVVALAMVRAATFDRFAPWIQIIDDFARSAIEGLEFVPHLCALFQHFPFVGRDDGNRVLG